MIKKIKVDQLRPGMFINKFNCSWLRHPFYRNNLKVTNEEIINIIIKSGVLEVDIDTDRGSDIADLPEEGDIGKENQTGPGDVIRPEEDNKGHVEAHDVSAGAGEISGGPVSTVQNIKDNTISDRLSEIQGGTVPVHGESSKGKGSLKTARQITEDVMSGTKSETQSRTAPVHSGPPGAKGPREKAQEGMKDTVSGTKSETQSGTAPVHSGPPGAKGPREKAQERMNDTVSGTKSRAQGGTVSLNEGSDAGEKPVQTVEEMIRIISPGKQPDIQIAPVPVQEELKKAKEIKTEAKKIVRDIMEDIKLGRHLNMEKVNNVIDKMVNSILRNKDALTGLGRIKKVDEYTFMHSVNVGVLMVTFGKHLGFDSELLKAIGVGGLLHDMGKTRVPGELLTKKGRLSEDEMLKVKKHVEHSNNILKDTAGINEVSVYVAAHHHERLDGTGYPNHLKAGDINIFGQMSAIVDVYDALTSDRCYQKGILPTLALQKLHGWQMYFNKELLHQFIRCIGIYPVGSLVRLQSGLICVVLSHNEANLLYPVVRAIYNTRKDTYIMPFDIDLLEDFKKGGKDSVVCCELPDKWKIRPEAYL